MPTNFFVCLGETGWQSRTQQHLGHLLCFVLVLGNSSVCVKTWEIREIIIYNMKIRDKGTTAIRQHWHCDEHDEVVQLSVKIYITIAKVLHLLRCLFVILISIAACASASSSEIKGGLRNPPLVGPYRGRATSRSSWSSLTPLMKMNISNGTLKFKLPTVLWRWRQRL